MFFLYFIIFLAVGGIIAALVKNIPPKKKPALGKEGVSWSKFYQKGKQEGFSTQEIKLLYELATRSAMENPTALFWSGVSMDNCLKAFVQDLNIKKTLDMPDNQDFLSRLFEFRKKIEMNRPKNKNGIKSSKEMSDMQSVQVVNDGVGIFNSKVVSVNSIFLSIQRPDSSVLDHHFKWKGQHILIYFWRKEDAGYCFETNVIDEVFTETNVPILKLTHSDKLLRTQTRKTLRVKTHRNANLYTVGVANDDDVSVVPCVKCILEDISDGGCSVTIGGAGESGLRIIVQFKINNTPLSISGMVRSVNYNKEQNTSVLHIESDIIPSAVKNLIMGLMFGAITDEFDTVPLEVEAEDLGRAAEQATIEDPLQKIKSISTSDKINPIPTIDRGAVGYSFDYSQGGVSAKPQTAEIKEITEEDFDMNRPAT
ncbi:MAG: hypothetical protein Ta2B_01350 [Termitinemataceae bacterium]|nr:MAG: hypothetical protein Ta2B_01350 [Termitinemataceae bacterium]